MEKSAKIFFGRTIRGTVYFILSRAIRGTVYLILQEDNSGDSLLNSSEDNSGDSFNSELIVVEFSKKSLAEFLFTRVRPGSVLIL